jgi:hypothetical protein
MNTKTHGKLLTSSHGGSAPVAVDARWPSFRGVLLSIQSTRKMIEAQKGSNPQTINGMIDYSGEGLEKGLERK